MRFSRSQLLRSVLHGIAMVAMLIATCAHFAFGQEHTIKFATLAPEGSAGMIVMREYDEAVRKESGGRLGFKIYPGAIQGDEINVLRKIRLGQLQSAGVTGNGLTTIAPEVRILDGPFLFHSYAEADEVVRVYDKEFRAALEKGGYVLLGWTEVGFVYVFTNTPVRVPEDMRRVKMWTWQGDPIAEAAFKALSVDPIPLSITDVPTSLQTGLIDGVYTSPLYLIALQWFTRVKYMLDQPLADVSGAAIISKKVFDTLPPDLQEILLRNGKKYMRKLTELTREENAKSIQTLKERGIQIIEPPSAAAVAQYEEIGKRARQYLVGKLFSQDFLSKVEATVLEYRKAHPAK